MERLPAGTVKAFLESGGVKNGERLSAEATSSSRKAVKSSPGVPRSLQSLL